MTILTTIFATLIALEFFYIMYLETFATDSENTSRIFNIPVEELKNKNLNTLFKNQGVYNELISLGLLYGLFLAPHKPEIVVPILIYIVTVATYGALTSDKKIILTQGGLAILTLICIFLGI